MFYLFWYEKGSLKELRRLSISYGDTRCFVNDIFNGNLFTCQLIDYFLPGDTNYIKSALLLERVAIWKLESWGWPGNGWKMELGLSVTKFPNFVQL